MMGFVVCNIRYKENLFREIMAKCKSSRKSKVKANDISVSSTVQEKRLIKVIKWFKVNKVLIR